MKQKIIAVLALSVLLMFSTQARANISGDMAAGLPMKQVFKNALAGDSSKENVQAAMKDMKAAGAKEEDVVKAAFDANIDSEAVIQCALGAGCDVRNVVKVALAEGLAPEFVAKCCHSSGADPETVASAIALLTVDGTSDDNTSSGSGSGYTVARSLGSIPTGGGGGGGADLSPNQ